MTRRLTVEEACRLVDIDGDNHELPDPTVTWWNVARTLRQALAEAQAERDAAKRETWANISSTQIWMDLEAERDALRRKLDAAIVAFRRLASPEAFDVSRIATTEERKRMFFAEQALVTLESDPT